LGIEHAGTQKLSVVWIPPTNEKSPCAQRPPLLFITLDSFLALGRADGRRVHAGGLNESMHDGVRPLGAGGTGWLTGHLLAWDALLQLSLIHI